MEFCYEICFLGKQDVVEELLVIVDLFIMFLGSESFGLVVFEAMVCEVFVIFFDVGGLLEVNIYGKIGYFSLVGDVEDMACNVFSIFQDDKKLQIFCCYVLVQAKCFDIDNIFL